MGLFSYVYYSSLIRVSSHLLIALKLIEYLQIQYVTVGSIMQTVVTSLSVAEQLELLRDLRKYLAGQGIRVK